ncbi:MAG: hypothetical protein ACKO25_10260 [Cyanobium sp.]
MADANYLVALAMLERGGQRAVPLTGRSCRPEAALAEDPGEEGRGLALELLLRLWQGSDAEAFRRVAGDASLLPLELPLETMSEQLPILKAGWINNGDTAGFQSRMRAQAQRAWTISLAKYEPIRFHPWP